MKNFTVPEPLTTSRMRHLEQVKLFRNSKLAQVAKPLDESLRGTNNFPTHQIIFTPKSSAIRSSFGIKTSLPKQIGYSHIVFNDIDNYKGMPDVEKYSGPMYNRLKFQESGLTLKSYLNENNPLFPSNTTNTNLRKDSLSDSILTYLNLPSNATGLQVKQLLKRNPNLYKDFKQWLAKNHPESILSNSSSKAHTFLKEYLLSSTKVKKEAFDFSDMGGASRNRNKFNKIQGTGGFSYSQKGRLSNSPNGVKQGNVLPGRLVGDREAAVGGFIASVNDRTILLQNNFAKNYPGKHPRQFVMPFKINEAEITENGKVKMYVDGVKVGTWMQRTNSGHNYLDGTNYDASNPVFGRATERNSKDNIPLESLLNLIGTSKN